MQAAPWLSVRIFKIALSGFCLNIRQCLSVQISAFLTDHTAQILRNAEYIRHYLIRVLEYINIDALQNIERRILSICARHIDCISLIDVAFSERLHITALLPETKCVHGIFQTPAVHTLDLPSG